MKKQVKIVSIILLVLITLTSISSVVFATAGTGVTKATINELNTGANSQVMGFGQKIVPIIRAVGIIAAVVILIIVGIRYMIGSAEEKAEYKKTMPAYVIGAVLVFAATQILGFVIDIANNSFNG